MIDAQNKAFMHLTIAVTTFLVVFISWFFMVGEVAFTKESILLASRPVGFIPFLLLFLVMIIGPLMKLFPVLFPKWGDFPWNWRAELGIWFAVWSVIHMLFVFAGREWNVGAYLANISPWALGALIAVFMAIVLALISFRGAINFLGPESWKWLQNYFTYVIWWLVVIHVLNLALLRPSFPSEDWLHCLYLVMVLLVPFLQTLAFIKVVKENRKKLKESNQN
jgi:sulfoxide reductase heme-binding subunit YedZ